MSSSKRVRQPKITSYEVAFANEEARKVHDAFGGLQVDEGGKLRYPVPENLENIRRVVVESKLLEPTLALHPDASKDEMYQWNELLNSLAETELKAADLNKGRFQIFSGMLVTIGKRTELIDPWINLIPNEYGLCIIKSSLLILMKIAQRHTEKRQKILDGFMEIRNAICDASLKRKSFQTDPQVCESAGNLYVSIVDAIEELLDVMLAFSSPSNSKWLRKLVKSKDERVAAKKHDLDAIMQKVYDAANKFRASIDTCRDEHIETTHVKVEEVLVVSVEAASQIRNMSGQMSDGFDGMGRQLGKHSQDSEALQMQQLQGLETLHTDVEQVSLQLELMRNREAATEELVNMLTEERKKNKAMAARLKNFYLKSRQTRTDEAHLPSKAVTSLPRLLQILSASSPDQIPTSNSAIDFELLLAERDKDLQTILNWSSRVEPSAQAQAHSLLKQDRFFEWMRSGHPDMLLVDGNLFVRGAVPQEKISGMSLLCANFILSMSSLDSTHVFLHFYCGLHSHLGDAWYGPSGLVRSVIIQLLVTLEDKSQLDLDIIDRRSFLQKLEHHSLDELCILLHQLVRQFTPDTTVFLVIDGISHFDLDLRGMFNKLTIVLNCLQDIVEDDELRPRFKVLMTAPTKSSWRLGQVVDQSYRLGLSLSKLNPRSFSQRRVEMALLQPVPVSIGPSQSMREGDFEDDEAYYDD